MNEIIIDGVNVAECKEHFTHYDYWDNCDKDMCDACNDECKPRDLGCLHYIINLETKLERLEAENKQLKQENQAYRRSIKDTNIVAIVEENEKLKADKKQLLKDCNSCNFHKYQQALEDIKTELLQNSSANSKEIRNVLAIIDEVLK